MDTDVGQPRPLEVRSFRTVFELERRVYRIDRLRLPPGGLPVRGAVYGVGLMLTIAALSSLPLLGAVASLLPWYVRDLALPIALAALMTIVRIEGRPFHLAARALARQRLGPRWLCGLRPTAPPNRRWNPGELVMLPDGSEGTWRSFTFTGAGAVVVLGAHECRSARGAMAATLLRRPHVTVRQRPSEPGPPSRQVVALGSGTRLRVRPIKPPRRNGARRRLPRPTL